MSKAARLGISVELCVAFTLAAAGSPACGTAPPDEPSAPHRPGVTHLPHQELAPGAQTPPLPAPQPGPTPARPAGTPLVGLSVIDYRMIGFSGRSVEYRLDRTAWTMSGYDVTPDGVTAGMKRVRLDQPRALTAAARDQLIEVLRQVQIYTLSSAECDALRADHSGVIFDGDFPTLFVDGGRYDASPTSCSGFSDLSASGLGPALDAAFNSLAPIADTVVWTGSGFAPAS